LPETTCLHRLFIQDSEMAAFLQLQDSIAEDAAACLKALEPQLMQ
jgi:hypothetical protein